MSATSSTAAGASQPFSVGPRQQFRRGEVIFVQGERAHNVYYIERGRVQLTTVSPSGKEATIAVISPGTFFGEGCLTEGTERLVTARALTDCTLISVDRSRLEVLLHCHPESSLVQQFLHHLVTRSREFEEYIIDQVFNSSERKLAHVLLTLAYHNRDTQKERTIHGITHEMLAGLIGTTRARVTVFMAKFRKRKLIDYSRQSILVRPALRLALPGVKHTPRLAPRQVQSVVTTSHEIRSRSTQNLRRQHVA